MKLKTFLLFLFLFVAEYTYSQISDIDQRNMSKVEYFANTNIDSLIFYSKEMLKSSNKCVVTNGEILIANVDYKKGDYNASEQKINKILSDIKFENSLCQKRNKINALNRLFWIKKNQNKFDEALSSILKREKIVNSLSDKNPQHLKYQRNIDFNLAAIKQILGFNREAINILKKSLKKEYLFNSNEVLNNYHQRLSKSGFNNMIGDSYVYLNSLDSALIFYKRAYEISKGLQPKHKNSETLYKLRVANVLVKKQKYKEALKLINQYDDHSEEYLTTQNINFLKSFSFSNLNETDSSIYYCKKFLNYKKQTPAADKNRIVIYNTLAEKYNQKDQKDSAYKYSSIALKAYNVLEKSKFEVNKSHYLYDFEHIKILNSTLLRRKENKQKSLIMFFSILTFILIGSVFITYKRKKKITEKYNVISENLQNSASKTAYNIEEDLENRILEGLKDLESSKQFLNTNFNIQLLAKELETNTTYISSIINSKKGISFKQFVAELRINYLIKQLETNPKYRKYTIKALAQGIGYTNASAFTRAFKKLRNETPSEFLNSLQD